MTIFLAGRRLLFALFLFVLPAAAIAQPSFTGAVSPDQIGEGTSTRLSFAIDNSEGGASVTGLGFSLVLPAVVTVADGPITDTCNGTLGAVPGGGSVTYSGGALGAGESCTISLLIRAAEPGSFDLVTGELTSDAGNSGTASASFIAVSARVVTDLSLGADPLSIGQTTTLSVAIDNQTGSFMSNYTGPITLPEQLRVAPAPNVTTTCPSQTITAEPDSALITPAFGFLLDGESCVYTVAVRAALPGDFDIESAVSASLSGPVVPQGIATLSGTVASPPPGAVTLLRETAANEVLAGGAVDVTYTLVNNDGSAAATGLTFSEDLDAALSGLTATGLPIADVCGAGSSLSGGETITLAGGALAARDRCSFTVSLAVPAGAPTGTYTLATGQLSGLLAGAPFVSAAAEDEISVVGDGALPPVLSKSFLAPVRPGDTATVEFTVSNPNSAATVSSMAFTDGGGAVSLVPVTLPDSGYCSGSGSANTTFASEAQFFNISLAAEDSCTFQVPYSVPANAAPGTYDIATQAPTASVGGVSVTGQAATASLTVEGSAELAVAHSPSPDQIASGGRFTAVFEIENAAEAAGPGDASLQYDLSFVGATAADVVSASGSCSGGGSTTATAGGAAIYDVAFNGIAPGENCVAEIEITVPGGTAAGSYVSSTGDITLSDDTGTRTVAARTRTLTVLPAEPLVVSRSIVPNPAYAGQTVDVTYTFTNPDDTTDYTGVSVTQGFGVAPFASVGTLPADGFCGAGSAFLSGSTLILSTMTVPASGDCSVTVPVTLDTDAADGPYTLRSGTVISDQGSFAPVVSTLDVATQFLRFEAAFAEETVRAGETVVLELAVTNDSASVAAENVAFDLDLDAALSGGLIVGFPSFDCASWEVEIIDDNDFSGKIDALAPGETCRIPITVAVPADAPVGATTFTTSPLQFDTGAITQTGPTAAATITVNGANSPGFTRGFESPRLGGSSVFAGETVNLTFRIDNNLAGTALADIGFAEDLSAIASGLTVSSLPSTPCGAGSRLQVVGDTLSLLDGRLSAAGNCSFSVPVAVPSGTAAGDYSGDVLSLAATAGGVPVPADAAAPTLTVAAAPAASAAFAPATVDQGGAATWTLTLDNSGAVIPTEAAATSVPLPAGLVVASVPEAGSTCALSGGFSPSGGAGSLSFPAATVAAGASCTFSVNLTPQQPDDLSLDASVTFTGGAVVGTSAALAVTPAPAPTMTLMATPDSVAEGGTTTLTLTIDNSGALVPATALAVDVPGSGAPFTLATPAGLSTTCTGGTVSGAGGAFSLAGATVAAGASCTLSANVVPAATGTTTVTTLTLSSSLGTSPAASASFGVPAIALDDPLPDAPVFGPAEAADVTVSGTVEAVEDGRTVAIAVRDSGSGVANGSAIVSGGAFSADLDLSGLADGTLSITADVADEAGTPATQATAAIDKDAAAPQGYSAAFDQPTVSLANQTAVSFTLDAAEIGSILNWTITSDGGSGQVDGTATAATATDRVSGIDVSALPDGTLTLSVTLTDPRGNTGAPVTATVSKDVAGPSVVLTGPEDAQSDPFEITVTFSEPVTGFDLTDLDIVNGAASNLASQTGGESLPSPTLIAAYTVTVTPDHDGPVVITLPAGAAADEVDNPSQDSNTLTVIADLTGTPNPAPPADNDGDGIPDTLESASADRDGDGIPDAQDYDPQGYFYCEDDGRIMPGGGITVSGPSGSNSSVGTANDIRIVADGTTGEYQWFAQVPGTFTVVYDYPTALGIPSTARTVSGGALDVTSLLPDNPAVLGSTEFGSTGFLADASLATNPVYYDQFVIEAGDPYVLANNIPMTQCAENPVTVEITNALESDGEISFTASQQRISTQDTVIAYSLGGTATPGVDYTVPSGTVTIPAGETSALVSIDIIDDTDIEGDETLTVTLDAIDAGDATTVLGAPANIEDTGTITDDDLADIGVDYVDSTASESGDTARMDFYLQGTPASPVTLSLGGDAQCTVSPATMTFTAATFDDRQSLTIRAINDDKVEGTHSCTPTVIVRSADSRFDGVVVSLAAVTVTDDLVDQIREPLTEILKEDLKETVQTQSRRFSDIARGARDRLRAGPDSLPCGTVAGLDVDGSIAIEGGAGRSAGTFGSDVFDCAAGRREILDGAFTISRNDTLGTQAQLHFAMQRERFVSDAALRGWFWGGYMSRTTVTDLADGDITGFGANAGIYGAQGLEGGLMLDWYAAGAAGKHRFDLTFADPAADIDAEGDYAYAALFAGVALSGERAYEGLTLRPRAGVDVAHAWVGDADVTATQLALTDTGTIALPDFTGGRVFAEVAFESIGTPEGAARFTAATRTLFTPRLSCEGNSFDDTWDCGVGAALEWERSDPTTGVTLGFEVGYEHIDATDRLTLDFTHERLFARGAGAVVTRLSFPTPEAVALEYGVDVTF